MANDDLFEPLKAINQTIARLREDVQTLIGEVKKIPSAIEEATATLRDAIHENIQAQAELKLMDHVMEVRSVKPQINAEHEQITTERDELEERLESIGDRYTRQHEELDEKARQRIRNLGEHIFEINEDHFQEGIEKPFTEQVTATWQNLQQHNESVREDRTERMKTTTGDAVQTIHDFVDRQDELVRTIQDHRLDPQQVDLPAEEMDRLQVPFYHVEYEVDGHREETIVVPSVLGTNQESSWTTIETDPIEGADTLLRDVQVRHDATRTESVTKADIAGVLEDYNTTARLAPSYSEAVTEAVPEDETIPVRVPGGDE